MEDTHPCFYDRKPAEEDSYSVPSGMHSGGFSSPVLHPLGHQLFNLLPGWGKI
jgi:hypothetical protein